VQFSWQGLTNREIGKIVGTTEPVLKNHLLRSTFDKLQPTVLSAVRPGVACRACDSGELRLLLFSRFFEHVVFQGRGRSRIQAFSHEDGVAALFDDDAAFVGRPGMTAAQ
jgi:hypothetical protein